MIIKPLHLPTDSNELVRLHLSINGEDTDENVIQFYLEYGGDVWVVHFEGKIIGFSALSKCLWNNISIIEGMAIDKKFQNRGFGKNLLDFVVKHAKHRGDRFITVQTATWNKKGIKFYEREGFVSKIVFEKYFGNEIDMVWLEMKLNE